MPSKKKTDPGKAGQAMAEHIGEEEFAPAATAPTGDGGTREEEVSQAIQAVEALADQLQIEDEKKLVASVTAFFVDLFKSRPKPWAELSQAEQRDLCAALEHNAREFVRMAVEAVARGGRDPIRALLESWGEKDGIKVTLKVKTYDEEEALAAVIGLHKAQGKHVLITVASADDYAEHPAADASEPDQPSLGFEAGDDEIPEDQSDLAEAGGPEPAGELGPEFTELARTGTQILVSGHGLCDCQINLKSGMVEALVSDGDGQEVVDVRAATPAELAVERERVADFADSEA